MPSSRPRRGRPGYRVGLFTSPHLDDVRERIQVDREPVTPAELATLIGEIAPAVARLDRHGPTAGATFFEVTTAAGLMHFVRRRCELVVLEVGLGGRFDSTNVVRPVVTAVTSIGLDHTAQLGATVELIAYQKAGILKRGVPAVVGPLDPGPMAVVRAVAAAVGAPVTLSGGRPVPAVGLPGEHQRENAAVAVAVIGHLRRAGFHIPAAAVAARVRGGRLAGPGRTGADPAGGGARLGPQRAERAGARGDAVGGRAGGA